MKVYTEDSGMEKPGNAVVTVGSFDGLHIGHKKILDKVKEYAQNKSGESYIVTFEPHPRFVLSHNFDFKILTSLEEKKEILKDFGIDGLFIIKFTTGFSQLTSEEFIDRYIAGLFGASHMIIGYDHKFGRDRMGDAVRLSRIGSVKNFDVTDVPAVTVGGEIVSSTAIRNALSEGNIEKANLFLGRYYSLSGIVVKGAQRGRLLGFPTANIEPGEKNKAIPMKGVYFVGCVVDDQTHFGVMNIGYRPTFENKHELVLEVHILNFGKDIYGKPFKISFLKRLREEKKFESKEALIHQMEIDKMSAFELTEKFS